MNCALCGSQIPALLPVALIGSDGLEFCSPQCCRCYDCEHRSGVACWYRVNMGKRAGHAWVKAVKRCPKEKHADA